MIPKECKRLAEVDFPIAVVSKHSAREKSIRHGHPSTLHLWWARRPLAACRAVRLGLLLPDPCDKNCPEDFKNKVRELLPRVQGKPGPKDIDLRKSLLKFIGDFANWDLSTNQDYLEVSRGLVKAAHGEEKPLVVDPFAGGGSIPLEALRLGCDAFASDLNPVACLILKVMLEDIPRHGPELAEELRRVGKEIKESAEKELKEFYPDDPDGSKPIAYLWARTVKCESPNCGAEIPLVHSFWLSKKQGRKRALKYTVKKNGKVPQVEFEIFEPKKDNEVPTGTVARANATCLCCNKILPAERVRAQLREQQGGADVIFDDMGNRIGGAYMLAVVVLHAGIGGRHYRIASENDYEAVWKTQKMLKKILKEWKYEGNKELCPIPDEELKRVPVTFGVINVWVYGMTHWGFLFAGRQKLSLVTLIKHIKKTSSNSHLLTLAMGKLLDHNSSLSRWAPSRETSAGTFGRQALPMLWDFSETNSIGDSTGSFESACDYVANVLVFLAKSITSKGQVELVSALKHPLPNRSSAVWFTDPPYYDNVPYSYLSDYFYVWHKRAVTIWPQLFSTTLTPKDEEAVSYLNGDSDATAARRRFEMMMGRAFSEGKRILNDKGIGSVVFAHKTTEGWEALLSGIIQGGWTITGSWPIATEMQSRLRAMDSAALATSVHLVCRPRPDGVPVGDWGEVLHELPKRVGDWMERLQGEGVRGADLVFACIGPALEIFSRYSKVETAEGREVKLAEYLEKVWEVVGRTALEQVLGTAEAKARNGAAGAVEEDARLTALFLWTLQSTKSKTNDNNKVSEEETDYDGESAEDSEQAEEDDETPLPKVKTKGFSLIYDVVRRFAQPLGIHLSDWEDRIIKTEKGVVRLLSVKERAQQLFGKEGAHQVADWLESDPNRVEQLELFPDRTEAAVPEIKGRKRGQQKKGGSQVSDDSLKTKYEATTLDRVHAAMLLQASGRANALRALLKAEQERSPDFLRLANALSALYPKNSDEKRLLDAMLLAVPR